MTDTTKTTRYHVTLADDRGGFASEALAAEFGSVVGTVQQFDGTNDLALIDVPDDHAELFDSILDADDNVLSYYGVGN